MSEQITVRGDNITVDLLLFRKYGIRGRSLVEDVYRINPRLAKLGPVLPLGTTVTIPDLPSEETSAPAQVVSLFG